MATNHFWEPTETTDTAITWTCTCGHLTIETVPEPSHHTPIAQRKAEHIAEAIEVDERTANFGLEPEKCGCPADVPAYHHHELVLTNPVSGIGHQVVIKAFWMGGWKYIYAWPRDTAGIAFAQAFCDTHPTTIERRIGGQSWSEQVKPGELDRYTNY